MCEWLHDLLSALLRIFPRFRIVTSVNGGVAYVRGVPHAVKSGCLYWYWPFWTELDIRPVKRQTLEIKPIPHPAIKTGAKAMSLGAVISYEVSDTIKAFAELHDLDESVDDLTKAVLVHLLKDKGIKEVTAEREQLDREFIKQMRAKMRPFGVNVKTAMLSSIAPVSVLMVLGQGGMIQTKEEE